MSVQRTRWGFQLEKDWEVVWHRGFQPDPHSTETYLSPWPWFIQCCSVAHGKAVRLPSFKLLNEPLIKVTEDFERCSNVVVMFIFVLYGI